METLEELEQKLQKMQIAIQELIKLELYEDSIKELFSEEQTLTRCKIIRLQTGSSPDTHITVKFPDTNTTIEVTQSKIAYKKAIQEFGVEEVYKHFPHYFLNHEDRLTDTESVAPNRYLIVGLNNLAKKRNLKAIESALNRTVHIFFTLQ